MYGCGVLTSKTGDTGVKVTNADADPIPLMVVVVLKLVLTKLDKVGRLVKYIFNL